MNGQDEGAEERVERVARLGGEELKQEPGEAVQRELQRDSVSDTPHRRGRQGKYVVRVWLVVESIRVRLLEVRRRRRRNRITRAHRPRDRALERQRIHNSLLPHRDKGEEGKQEKQDAAKRVGSKPLLF